MADDPYQIAMQLRQAGNLAEAESMLRQVLVSEPNRADALEALAYLLCQRQDLTGAEEMFQRATMAAPHLAHLHAAYGFVLASQKKYEQAVRALQQSLVISPNNPQFLVHLAVAYKAMGATEEAIDAYRNAIAVQPIFPEAYSNLGSLLTRPGQLDEAIMVLRQAIAQKPDFPEGHVNLSVALREAGRLDEAIDEARQAVTLRPVFAEAHYALGLTLLMQDRPQEALAALSNANDLRADYGEALHSLGAALMALDRDAEAIDKLQRAVQLQPDLSEPRYALAHALYQVGRIDESIAMYRQVLQRWPNHASSRLALTLALLLQGKYQEAWPGFEQRHDNRVPGETYGYPRWTGQDLKGRTILLCTEEGFGDVLQFIRYAPLVRDRGGKVIVQVTPVLKRLLTHQLGIEQVLTQGDPLPRIDFFVPLMSVASIFNTAVATIPSQSPYLIPDPALAETWEARLRQYQGLRVGLLWAGSNAHKYDRLRSLTLALFAPLVRIHGVSFFSLQKGPPAQQAKSPPPGLKLIDYTSELAGPPGLKLIDYTSELADFADTAALISELDLVIAPDTAVAHLAGALGKPVWTLLMFVPDWRWMLDRTDSPWYPTMRLFRQQRPKQWGPVIEQVATELEKLQLEMTSGT